MLLFSLCLGLGVNLLVFCDYFWASGPRNLVLSTCIFVCLGEMIVRSC